MKPKFEFKDSLKFDTARCDRGQYYVDFKVPAEGSKFAVANLIFHEATATAGVISALESEIEQWSRRYAVPVMASAFDASESLIHLTPEKPDSIPVGWIDGANALEVHWTVPKDEVMPGQPFTAAALVERFSDVPHRIITASEKRQDFELTARRNLVLRWMTVIWLVLIPAAILVLQQFNVPFGWICFWLAIARGAWKAAQLFGLIKPSKRQLAEEADALLMRHHDYHCRANPDGFERLKVENFIRESQERVKKEAEELKRRT